jgi:hypothetical protein
MNIESETKRYINEKKEIEKSDILDYDRTSLSLDNISDITKEVE